MKYLYIFLATGTLSFIARQIYDSYVFRKEDRAMWTAFYAKIENDRNEFYDRLFKALSESTEFLELINKYMNTPEYKLKQANQIAAQSYRNRPRTRCQKYKKYITNLFSHATTHKSKN